MDHNESSPISMPQPPADAAKGDLERPAADPAPSGLDASRPAGLKSLTVAAGLVAGLLASALTWAAGDATLDWFQPTTVGNAAMGPQHGGITIETSDRATVKNAALSYGLQGALLALVLGIAGAVARGSVRAAVPAAVTGVFLGGSLGALASMGLFSIYLKTYDPLSNDILLPLLTHAGVWTPLGAAAGLAFGLGQGGGPRRVARAALGGFIGAALGAAIYEVLGAALFPLAQTNLPIATSSSARLLAHASLNVLAALAAALAVNAARLTPEPR
jgi:hypothetical protein